FEEPVSFHVIKISSFYNHSWERNLGSGWLGDLQTHTWDSKSSTIIFLWPWSRGNFSNEEWMELETLFRIHFIVVSEAIHRRISELAFQYPCEIQLTAGCELHSGKLSGSFLRTAYQGLDYTSFQNNSCVPSPLGGDAAKRACKAFNQDQRNKDEIHHLVSDTCLRFLLGLLDAGKAYLQRQLSCRVKHSSLEGQDIVLYWEHHNSVGLIILAVIVPLLLLIVCLALWFRKRCSH
uniref:CD1a molecule n=1 Tax=Saimiri boliviensis boliviensis TaxID=39432 RepID=A0A2K6TF75_SAIBB